MLSGKASFRSKIYPKTYKPCRLGLLCAQMDAGPGASVQKKQNELIRFVVDDVDVNRAFPKEFSGQ